jgi:hypothetical protein
MAVRSCRRTAAPWLAGANTRERPPAETLSASPEAPTWPDPATPVLLSERKVLHLPSSLLVIFLARLRAHGGMDWSLDRHRLLS